jgi:hypothetical protein
MTYFVSIGKGTRETKQLLNVVDGFVIIWSRFSSTKMTNSQNMNANGMFQL